MRAVPSFLRSLKLLPPRFPFDSIVRITRRKIPFRRINRKRATKLSYANVPFRWKLFSKYLEHVFRYVCTDTPTDNAYTVYQHFLFYDRRIRNNDTNITVLKIEYVRSTGAKVIERNPWKSILVRITGGLPIRTAFAFSARIDIHCFCKGNRVAIYRQRAETTHSRIRPYNATYARLKTSSRRLSTNFENNFLCFKIFELKRWRFMTTSIGSYRTSEIVFYWPTTQVNRKFYLG